MEMMNAVTEALSTSYPSDKIVINDPEVVKTMRDIRREVCGGNVIPLDDLLRGGEIPLKDCIIADADTDGRIIEEYRFCVFEKRISESKDGDCCGAIQDTRNNEVSPIFLRDGKSPLNYPFLDESGFLAPRDNEHIIDLWGAWATIQICLLHPQCVEIFSNTDVIKERRRDKDKNGKRKRSTWYVKKHIIGEKETGSVYKEIKRHCQCWFVLGHWRHYKNGKSVFIKGYWKGPMRHLQRNLDEGRERKVV